MIQEETKHVWLRKTSKKEISNPKGSFQKLGKILR
jgi:hypothetical protein